jgi:hypothetical protein
VRHLWLPVLIGAGLVLSFYLPFVLNERFGRTAEYLAGRTGESDSGGFLFNNLPLYFQLLTVYNTTFQVYTAWIVLVFGLVFWTVRNDEGHKDERRKTKDEGLALVFRPSSFVSRSVAGLASSLLLATAAISAWQPGWLQLPNGINLALIGFGLPMLWLIMRPGVLFGMRVALLFFAVPFLAMGFVIAEPRTHFYTMHIGGALLIGAIVGALERWSVGTLERWSGGRGAVGGGRSAVVGRRWSVVGRRWSVVSRRWSVVGGRSSVVGRRSSTG